MHRRSFASLVPRGKSDVLPFEAIVGISETVLLFLEHSQFGKDLDLLQASKTNNNLGERWRKMTETMLRAQLHAIAPFGFSADARGIQDFSLACASTINSLDRGKHESGLKDLEEINQDTWSVLVKRGFGVKRVEWLDQPVARSLALGICSQLVNPNTLKVAEDVQKRSALPPVGKIDAIHNECIIPAYRYGMGALGIAFTDQSFAMTCASLHVWMQKDQMVGSTMQQGVQELMKKAPVLGGQV